MLTNEIVLKDQDEIACRLEAEFRELDGKEILISGGTGFVGQWILHGFVGAQRMYGFRPNIVVISRDPHKFRAANACFDQLNIEFITADIGELGDELILKRSVDFYIHGATDVATNPIDHQIDGVLRTGINGTLNSSRLAINNGCKRILNLSSGAVYGPQPKDLQRISESYTGAPSTLDSGTSYHHVKRLSEYLIHSEGMARGVEVVTARLFAFLGPFLARDSYFAAGNFLESARKKTRIEVLGNGQPVRTYQYPVDLVVALVGLLVRGSSGNAYNVGSDEEVTIAGLADLITSIGTIEHPPHIHGKSHNNLAGNRYVPDISKINRDIGFKNEISLSQAVNRTIHWLNLISN
jgi:nucleoside-diphosphate-sugar epimerase